MALADACPAAYDPRLATPIREELYRPPVYRDQAIWFEDLTDDPGRVWSVGVVPAQGMGEEWFDAVLGDVVARERRYVAKGVLSGVRVCLRDDDYSQFRRVLQKVSDRLGTIPWVRDLSEPAYSPAWYSGTSFF